MFTLARLSALLLGASVALASSVTVSYDPIYDKSSESLNGVACSNGKNGLVTKGYNTFGDLPDFPFIGGAAVVTGWNSTECGTCWQLAYKGNTVTVLAVDYTAAGFNIAEEALNDLTNGQAVQLGRVTATAKQVPASHCGF